MGQSLDPGYDLIITNGDSAGELLRNSFSSTEVLPWRDVLHDGPVPVTDTLEELSEQRADYLFERGWGDPDVLRDNMAARDRGLAHHETFNTVSLWFEHDLYDQLQLIQILAWFSENPRDQNGLILVQADDFLGTQTPESVQEIAKVAKPVRQNQLDLASRAWLAFRQATPESWAALLEGEISALPYLANTVRRTLQELPDAKSGLARTQQQILLAINDGIEKPGELFSAVGCMEDAAFMGDWSFWDWLDGLASDDAALIAPLVSKFSASMTQEEFAHYVDSDLRLTELGLQVLGGGKDYSEHARIDRWLGGTHVTNENLWRWDNEKDQLVSPT